jgi:3-oxoacyl-[acyl-carrier protein] reductase
MIVVSGAGSGIGRAVTQRLVADGGQVMAVGRRPEPLQRLAEELGKAVRPVAADVATEAGAAAVAADLAAAGQACAGVVAAAGGLTPDQPAASPLQQARREWQASFESNVLTAVLLVEALRAALERAGGRIVLVSSVAALRGSGGGPYGAMKAALHAWAYDLARELGPSGGTANVVAPGFVPDTGFWPGG